VTSARRRWPAWLWAVSVAVALASAGLLLVGAGHHTPADSFGLSGLGGASFVAASLAFTTVGALISVRVAGNPIGWIFCLIGMTLAVGTLLYQYADAALFISDRPGGVMAACLQNFGLPPCFGLLGVAVLVFPDGHLPSRRWRPVLALAVAGILGNVVGYALRPGPLDAPFDNVVNPIGIDGTFGLMDALTGLGWMFMGASVGLAAVASARRLRRATGVERAQLKWLALAAGVTGVAIVADVASYFADATGLEQARVVVLGLGFLVFPLTVGAAILRLRLYDVDVVIRRTVVYAALTATLAAAYLATVLVAGLAVGHSGLAVAVSTLAVAALFGPARARIQAVVDRRFYRRRYDAARTLEAFSSRLRDEVDLHTLQRELVGVVRSTVQPAHVGLWLPRNDSRTDGP
jgi:hypothetical protein